MTGANHPHNRMTEVAYTLVQDAHDEAVGIAIELDEALDGDEPKDPTQMLGIVIEVERQVDVLSRLLVAARTTLQRGTGSGVVR